VRTELRFDDCWEGKFANEEIVSSRRSLSSGSLSVGTEGRGDGNLTNSHSELFRMEESEDPSPLSAWGSWYMTNESKIVKAMENG